MSKGGTARGSDFARRCRSRELDVEESLVQVGDDVFDVFDADGEADQAFGDANALADFGGHGGVGHRAPAAR